MQDQSTACSSSLDVARKTQSKKRDLTESSFSFSSPANISIGKRSKKEEEDILLSPEDYDLWTSSFAAKLAAGSYLPTCRKLGTITRWLEPTTAAHKKLPWLLKHSQYKNKRPKVTPTDRRTIPLLTLNQAKKHVLERRKDYTLLEDEAKQFQNQFLKLREQGQYRPNWDESTGQLLDHDLSCHQILRWMTGNKKEPTKLVDLTSTPKFSRPESSEDVALDTIRVLRALVDLMKPHKALYDQPLMVCLVKLSPLQDDEKRYKLQIAVYANRLLFEIMTQQLQTVMAAIDDSFSLGKFQALYTPPSVTLATKDFESSFFPKVILPNDGAHAHAHAHADTIDLTQDDDHENQEGSTRCNSKTIEAFSIPGLFKLIENKGTFDPTLWNHLKPKLYLELELLTHQEHGICWMYSMERIGNLNQLIWERRQFEEGDSYYYSPAFGQVRLTLSSDISSNNEMSGTIRGGGGILADEMG